MHLLLYGGQSTGLAVLGDELADVTYALAGNKVNHIGFEGSNGLDWSNLGSGGGVVDLIDKYAAWRLVSEGMRLSLLNPAEEDDGWWEACRISIPTDSSAWRFTTTDCTLNRTADGCVGPNTILAQLSIQSIVNERSYTTGLLRDLKHHVFKLNPRHDEHDMKQQVDRRDLDTEDIVTYDSIDTVATIGVGRDDVVDLIERTVDMSFDFIYVRIRGRTGVNKSRLHANVVSNQEITFAPSEREARFHTKSSNIGAQMPAHVAASRASGSASHVVPTV